MDPTGVITDAKGRAAFVNGLVGKRYRAGASGPVEYDCYGLTKLLQRVFYGRALPAFALTAGAGRMAVATAIATHPDRARWREVAAPVDGAIAVMARQECGFHMGTYVDLDGGIVVHALEEPGVAADHAWWLKSPGGGRWGIGWYVPATSTERAS